MNRFAVALILFAVLPWPTRAQTFIRSLPTSTNVTSATKVPVDDATYGTRAITVNNLLVGVSTNPAVLAAITNVVTDVSTTLLGNKLDTTNGTAVNLTFSGGLNYNLADEPELVFGVDYGMALNVGLTATSVRARVRSVPDIATMTNSVNPLNSDLFSSFRVLGSQGGDFRIVTTNGITFDNGIWFPSALSATFCFERVVNSPLLDVRWWGPTAGAGYGAENSPKLQAAVNYASTLNGAEVFFPELYRISETLVVKRNTKLIAARPSTYTEAATIVTNATLYKGGYSGGVALENGADITAIRFDSTGGYVRQENISMWDGTTPAEKRFLNSGLQNLIVQGNESNQTNTFRPLIEARHMWNISIDNCYLGSAKGPSAWFRDINGLLFRNNIIQSGRGILLDDIADSDFSHNMTYASFGPSWKVISTWKNTFVGNHSGNATNGLQGTISSVSGNILTASATHNLYTGALLWTYATGSLPSPLVSTRPYYVIRLSSTTFSVATTLDNAEAGTAQTLTTAGSGTITYTDGPAYSWALYSPSGPGTGSASGTIRNTFVGNRSDQNYEGGWFLDGADENTFVGNYVIESGFYGTNTVRAVVLTNGASYNSFTGNEIDSSNDYGFSVGDNSVANVFSGNSVLATTPWEWGATGTSANYVPVAGQGSGTNIYGGSLAIGQAADGNVVTFTGNASGTRIIKANRTSGLTQSLGLGVGTAAWNLWNETAGVGMALIGGTSSETSYLGGAGQGGASPRSLTIRPEDASSGSNSPGTNLVLQAAAGTGNSTTGGDIIFQTPDAGSSGTTVQSKTTKVTIQRDGDLVTAGNIELGNASDTTLSRLSAGQLAVEGVQVALKPTTETLTYSGGTNVTITAGKGPMQRSVLTVTNNFQLLWSGLTDNDSGVVHLIPDTTNRTILVSSPGRAAGSSAATATGSTTLTITGATNGWAELAWSVVPVGGTNRVSVNLGAY
jgi:hypothetical protein